MVARKRVAALLVGDYDLRAEEYLVSWKLLNGCHRILDAGCGTGTFLAHAPDRIEGIDINPDNVAYCRERALNATVGSVLEIPFPADSFDAVHCSHVMQVFAPDEAAQMLREFIRVVRPGGNIVISTLNWHPRFFQHPENARPYPPDALMRYFAERGGATSPMRRGIGTATLEYVWKRRPPLIEFHHSSDARWTGRLQLLNRSQMRFGLRKFWSYDAYIAKLRVTAKA
jgi:SAM-dependent methyltransferase